MASDEPAAERPCFRLARVGLAVNARLRSAMTVTGLKPRQCLTLMVLAEDGRMSQLALAQALEVDPSVLVSILNELEQRDLATRQREPSDRRRHVVVLTEHGREVVGRIKAAVDEVERAVFADFDPAELARLDDLLRRLAAPHDSADCAED
ncbi:hypothetical protein ALI144C_15265 [Actinosynnema sp. ALI-1.44]|uniref:MarR family winged helix-turn-helix transcriptional regulator n=1 Tax=Actinosynnema sp. ALI-1.44 TaxID=1933779 RepID=UPI00097C1B3E|nr:MarR family transcriptional regulator [Actinosynnema sp. ALI-1.44]ONI84067.1 hypothetical protein ALI144C_15265 [Actinosynnema sp. ALI-1.44]